MQSYKPSSSALLDGVAELERFFASYKADILASLRGKQQLSPARFHSTQQQQQQQLELFASADRELCAAALGDAATPPHQQPAAQHNNPTAREHHRSTVEEEQFNRRLLGPDYGVVDVVAHLFSRHGTSHTLLDAIEHLDLLVPNWHEPRMDPKTGELLETPQMRVMALRASTAADAHAPAHRQQQKWRKSYSVADICERTGLKNEPAVVRLLERDRGVGTTLWKVQHPVDADCAPGQQQTDPSARFHTATSTADTKKPHGWRSRIKFAAALRAIQDRSFVSAEARETVRYLEQISLPNCSFEPADLISMAHALDAKLVFDADRATREDMISDLQQQIRAIESFIRALEADQQRMGESGEMAQLRAAAIQQVEWYERLLRAAESQFDIACEDVSSVEEARKQRHWAVFRASRGDLPCVQGRIHARIGRLQSAAGRVRDVLHEEAALYESDLEQLDADIAASTTNCVSHLKNLRGSWDELQEALRKAAAAEKKFTDLGASLRATVEDRLDLLGARAMKDKSHAALLAASNAVLLDFSKEVERLKNSNDFLSELHTIACSGSKNVTQQYDERRAALLQQAEGLREQHQRWVQEYSVALGRHRHRISAQLSDAEEIERSAEMRREMGADLLDLHTRAHAIARDEASTNKVRLRAELAALDGSFHARNDAFKNRGVALNMLRQFVKELQDQADSIREGKGGMLDPPKQKTDEDDKKKSTADENEDDYQDKRHRETTAPLYDTSNIDLVNLTSLHHLEKHVRNRFEAAGHSKQEQAAREVMWEKDRIEQAKEATRAVRRVPLGPVSVATSAPAFLSPAPPSAASGWGVAPRRPGSAAPTTTTTPSSSSNQYSATSLPAAARYISSTATYAKVSAACDRAQPTSSSIATTRPQTAPALRTRTGGQVIAGQCLRVVFPFEPRVDDELRLQRGDAVIVLRSGEDPGWAFGVSGDKMGQFPLNYCEAVPV